MYSSGDYGTVDSDFIYPESVFSHPDGSGRVVIDAGRVDVGDFLIKTTLAGADILKAAGQFIEVVSCLAGVFQVLIVEHEAFDEVFFQLGTCPLPVANARLATYPVAQGQHHVEVVVCYLVVFAIRGSCSEKPDN